MACLLQPTVYDGAEEQAELALKRIQQREEDDRFYGNNNSVSD